MLPPPPVLAPPVGAVDAAGDTVATAVAVGVAGVGVGVADGLQGFFDDAAAAEAVFLQGFFDDAAAAEAVFLPGFDHVGLGLGLGDQELSSLPLLFQPLPSSPFPLPLPCPATETLALVLAVDSVLACAAVPVTINAVTPMAKQPAVTRIRPAIPAPPLQDCSCMVPQ